MVSANPTIAIQGVQGDAYYYYYCYTFVLRALLVLESHRIIYLHRDRFFLGIAEDCPRMHLPYAN